MVPSLSPSGWRWLAVCLIAAAGLGAVQAQQLDVVYVPTPKETVDRMLALTAVGRDDFVIDLGSGDGRIAIAAGKLGARALGVDLDPNRIREANANAQAAGVTDRVTFRQQNLFDTDLSQASVLTMYLLPSLNLKLRPRILALRPGTRVASHDFSMGDWKADIHETTNWRIHFWIVPARVAGTWQLRSGDRQFAVTIEQTFQEIRGSATVDGSQVPLRDAKLRGGEIEFSVDIAGRPISFRGTVSGDKIQGKAAGGDWTATRS